MTYRTLIAFAAIALLAACTPARENAVENPTVSGAVENGVTESRAVESAGQQLQGAATDLEQAAHDKIEQSKSAAREHADEAMSKADSAMSKVADEAAKYMPESN